MNNLIQPIFSKKGWGSEIIWALTDHYLAKTIEVDPGKVTDLLVFEKKEKSIIVVSGKLVLASGKCCSEDDLNYYELEEGWTWYIPKGHIHRYGATDKPLRLIEVASPEVDEAIIIDEEMLL